MIKIPSRWEICIVYVSILVVQAETIERYQGIVPTDVVKLNRKIPMHCSLFIRCVKCEKQKIPMCNSPSMRYAGDAGELEEFSCAVGDLHSNAERVTLGKSGHEL